MFDSGFVGVGVVLVLVLVNCGFSEGDSIDNVDRCTEKLAGQGVTTSKKTRYIQLIRRDVFSAKLTNYNKRLRHSISRANHVFHAGVSHKP